MAIAIVSGLPNAIVSGLPNVHYGLAQAIVADRDFIAQFSSAIWANIAPTFNKSPGEAARKDTAMPTGHAELLPPGVSSISGSNGYYRRHQ